MTSIIEADDSVMGAGSAGCVPGAPLSEDGRRKGPRLEAGGDDRPAKNPFSLMITQKASDMIRQAPKMEVAA